MKRYISKDLDFGDKLPGSVSTLEQEKAPSEALGVLAGDMDRRLRVLEVFFQQFSGLDSQMGGLQEGMQLLTKEFQLLKTKSENMLEVLHGGMEHLKQRVDKIEDDVSGVLAQTSEKSKELDALGQRLKGQSQDMKGILEEQSRQVLGFKKALKEAYRRLNLQDSENRQDLVDELVELQDL